MSAGAESRRRLGGDSDARWADDLLAPLRRQRLEIDVARSVMRRLESRPPLPGFAPLPGRWPGVAWAASMVLGLVCLGILLATAGVMVAQGDDGVRTLLSLSASTARLAARSAGTLAGLLAVFWTAALALAKGAWTVIELMAPLVRGAGFLAAAGGLLSVGFSLFVFAHARRAAPFADPGDLHSFNGGPS